ncbi:MAG: PadR family transcriptional regulator [Clostridium sp.]
MTTQLRKGVFEICVLTLVNNQDMYGYEIMETISRVMVVKESTIYPVLRRLTAEGYFDTYMRKSEEGPDRKYYRITLSGQEKLKIMISEWEQFVGDVNSILSIYRRSEGSE